MQNGTVYNEEYFERGIESGTSCYQNYRWTPELTMPMAMTIIDWLGIRRHESILELGCAKGYLVKAFRLLHRKACGVDISPYAIENVDPLVKDFCLLSSGWDDPEQYFDYCIAKDVLEHVPAENLKEVLKVNAGVLFAVIPLGEGGEFRAKANNLDTTHVTCCTQHWWEDEIEKCGWIVSDFTFKIEGIKDSYYGTYPDSHGFFTAMKR